MTFVVETGALLIKLVLMRHGEAAHLAGGLDHDRPLTQRGREQADSTASQLRAMDLNVGLILTSTARRARETGDHVQGCLGLEGSSSREQKASFYYEGLESLVSQLAQMDSAYQSVVAIGHNPTWSVAAQALTGGFRGLKTGECVVLTTDACSWEEAMTDTNWALEAYISPNVVP